MLDSLHTEYILLFLEDFLIEKRVDSSKVRRLVEIAIQEKVDCLRLSPLPEPTPLPRSKVARYPDLGWVEPGDPYRVSAQAAIWKVATLRQYLIPGLTAWEFEILGTQLSEISDHRFWGPFEPTVVYDHAIEKGRWKPHGLKVCQSADISVDVLARPAFTPDQWQDYSTSKKPDIKVRLRSEAVSAFSQARRREGLVKTMKYIRQSPLSLPMWGIGLFGLLGPSVLRWMKRRYVLTKVNRMVRQRGGTNCTELSSFSASSSRSVRCKKPII